MPVTLDSAFDSALELELQGWLSTNRLPDAYRHVLPAEPQLNVRGPSMRPSGDDDFTIKAVIKAHYRPSLLIQDNVFSVPASPTWQDLLTDHEQAMLDAIPAVGRVELDNHPSLSWVGTGFLCVQNDLLVTNRHVAVEFAARQGDGFTWRSFDNGEVHARVDLCAEHERPHQHVLLVSDILYLANDNDPDLAVLRVEGPDLPTAIDIGAPAEQGHAVATIGYPWKDSRTSALEETLQRIFDDAYDVKRLAPGRVREISDGAVGHDCSTLRGNSGSPVLDLETGAVVGVHARPARFNLAVPAHQLEVVMDEVM